MAILYSQNGQEDKAIETCKSLIKDDGENYNNIAVFASVYAELDNAKQGEIIIRQYIASRMDEANLQDHLLLARYLAQNSKNSDRILNAYQEAIKLEDKQNLEASRELADLFFSRKVFPQAAKLYEVILDQRKDDARVALRLTETYIKTNEFDKAAKLLDTIDLQDAQIGLTESLALKSIIAQKQGNFDEAIRYMNEAVGSDRDNSRIYYQRGRLLRSSGNRELWNDAVKDYNRAIELQPSLGVARRELAETYILQEKYDDAIREYRSLLEINEKDYSSRLKSHSTSKKQT